MLVSFGLLGIIQGIAIKNRRKSKDEEAQLRHEGDERYDEQE